MGKFSAVDIKKLWYGDCTSAELITANLTGSALYTLLHGGSLAELQNIHQNTWSIEESEPSQDSYKNQLTGATYRMGAKEMGEVTFNFTIGQYDYETKAKFMGYQTYTSGHWARKRGVVEKRMVLVALTEDDQYCVLPYANISAREADADGATGIGVVGTMLEPPTEAVMPEYWFDAAEVVQQQ